MRNAIACVVGFALFSGGCAKWKPDSRKTRTLHIPSGRMSPDSVSLEVGVAQLSHAQKEDLELLWKQLDQQKSSLELRKRLDANGLRVAVVPSQIPPTLHELLKPQEINPGRLNEFQLQMYDKGLLKPAKRLIQHQKIQNRDGESHELRVSSIHPAKSWVVYGKNGPSAGAGESVLGIFEIKTFPNGDGSVRLTITPQIHHGKPRTQIGVVDRSFLFQQKQTITSLDDVMIDLEIVPGETVLIGATPDFAGLAELFFCSPSARSKSEFGTQTSFSPAPEDSPEVSQNRRDHQRIVLIRLVQTQRDDLFSWRLTGEKLISTPHE